MAFTLPPLGDNGEIVTPTRRASLAFSRYWQRVLNEITKVINSIQSVQTEQSAVLARLLASELMTTAASNQAQSAAATANSAAAGKSAGAAVGVVWSCPTTARTVIASVPLVGIVAGTLRFDMTRIYPSGATAMGSDLASGLWWITEELTSGGARTDILTGPWSATGAGGLAFALAIDNESSLDAARPTAVNLGDVTYRLEIQRTSGFAVTDAMADLRVAQA